MFSHQVGQPNVYIHDFYGCWAQIAQVKPLTPAAEKIEVDIDKFSERNET
jgi:hypothetical protein